MKKKIPQTRLKVTRQDLPQEQRGHDYSRFDQLDGGHPWMDLMPEGHIQYPVRCLQKANVAYFNYHLAIEMGLIPADHPHEMNKALETKILETFAIRIVNEYDQLKNKKFENLKPKKYMATRYLQLQHPDKQGRTSGDGRCVWNGSVRHRGTVWDVSSRGTGVTKLAPGVVAAGKPLPSGGSQFGYGCGTADLDELYGAAIMAEIFWHHKIPTERVLAIVDLGNNIGIGVRAAKNLLRPAHIFLFLKQRKLDSLKRAMDYLIARQINNKEWRIPPHSKNIYDLALENIAHDFSRLSAVLEREYIFAWMDWDGDNILANGGIIDYGSVRQFGLRHDQYRYDDEDRFSTNLNEQRSKARLIVKLFAQAVDYIKTGNYKSLPAFDKHPILTNFDHQYEQTLLSHFLYQLGFTDKQSETLLVESPSLVKDLYEKFLHFERRKVSRKPKKVGDGINRPALFNMRKFSTELPRILEAANEPVVKEPELKELYELMLSEHARGRDRTCHPGFFHRIVDLQTSYHKLCATLASGGSLKRLFGTLHSRSEVINRPDRITGNAMIFVVEEIMKFRRKGLSASKIQRVIDHFILSQSRLPKDVRHLPSTKVIRSSLGSRLVENILQLVQEYSEDI